MTTPTTLALSPQLPDYTQANVKPNSHEAQLLSFVKTNYDKIKTARRGTEQQWYLNLAYYFGQQNSVVINTPQSSTGFRLSVPKAPPWRVRLVINHTRRVVRKEMASLTSQKPRWEVSPNSTEDADLFAARAAEQIFDFEYVDLEMQTRIKEAVWWACITGTGFTKQYWGGQNICYEALTPFHLFVPNFRVTDLEHQPFVIHAMTQTIDWVKQTFPDLGEIAATNTATNGILDDIFLGITGAQQLQSNQVLVLECWIKPKSTPLLPQGGVVTVVGDKLAQVIAKYPYNHGEYPFSRILNIPSGKFYGESMITDFIPLQKEYNRTRSQIVEAKNVLSKPKLLAAQGSVDASKITTEPGQVIYYKLGMTPPTALTLPSLPNYVLEQVGQLRADMDDLSGLHDSSNGTNPNQVTSATALSFLQEQDETMLSDTTNSIEVAIQKSGKQILGLAQQFWDTPRIIKVVGTDEAFDAQEFKGADINGNTDLRVESGSALPKSKAAKQAFLTDLMKLGVIPPQQGLEMLDLVGIDKILDDMLADKKQAQRENLTMQKGNSGNDLPTNEWDNHTMHIQVHNRYRKSETYETLSDEIKVMFQNHVKTHQAALMLQNNGDPTGSGLADNGLPAQAPSPQQEQPTTQSPLIDPSQQQMPQGGE